MARVVTVPPTSQLLVKFVSQQKDATVVLIMEVSVTAANKMVFGGHTEKYSEVSEGPYVPSVCQSWLIIYSRVSLT